MKIRLGSRGSKLAVMQTHWVATELQKKNPGLEITFQEISTAGDRDMSATFQAAGGKGVFVKEIEDALLAKEIDLAVHSLKDVPQHLPSGLMLGAFPEREDARDAVISRFGETLGELPRHSTVGSSSPRRQAQVAYLFKKREYNIQPLRGNIDTRIKKLHEGLYDSIILAAAGLKRLGLEVEITHLLEPTVFLPAATQGCLGLELRQDNDSLRELIETIKDPIAMITASAERSFLQGLGGNCFVPVGVYSQIVGEDLHMTAVLLDKAGTQSIRVEQKGPKAEPLLVGFQLAERLLYEGGSELMGLL